MKAEQSGLYLTKKLMMSLLPVLVFERMCWCVASSYPVLMHVLLCVACLLSLLVSFSLHFVEHRLDETALEMGEICRRVELGKEGLMQ